MGAAFLTSLLSTKSAPLNGPAAWLLTSCAQARLRNAASRLEWQGVPCQNSFPPTTFVPRSGA